MGIKKTIHTDHDRGKYNPEWREPELVKLREENAKLRQTVSRQKRTISDLNKKHESEHLPRTDDSQFAIKQEMALFVHQ